MCEFTDTFCFPWGWRCLVGFIVDVCGVVCTRCDILFFAVVCEVHRLFFSF